MGENPPDNDDAPIRSWDYTERREARQTAGNADLKNVELASPVSLLWLPTAQRLNLIAVGTAHGKSKEGEYDPEGVEQIGIFDPFRVGCRGL